MKLITVTKTVYLACHEPQRTTKKYWTGRTLTKALQTIRDRARIDFEHGQHREGDSYALQLESVQEVDSAVVEESLLATFNVEIV